ncbi:MAG: GNAT family N-acetyltransferase [Bdellovibrionales bacterium]|nr:GNAT family N-acetyltransferase [Bdellovibrionales bacterium]
MTSCGNYICMQIGITLKGKTADWREITYNEQGLEQLAQMMRRWQSDFEISSIEALVWDRPDDIDFCSELSRYGFLPSPDKIYLGRDLTGWKAPYKDHLEYQSLLTADDDLFIRVLEQILPNSNRPGRFIHPRQNIEFIHNQSGVASNPDLWLLAHLENRPAGVVCSHVYEDDTNKGTLLFIGVVPELRSRGIGKMLHAMGLNTLKKIGVRHYVGSAEISNTHMINLFRIHGCSPMGTQKHFCKTLSEV